MEDSKQKRVNSTTKPEPEVRSSITEAALEGRSRDIRETSSSEHSSESWDYSVGSDDADESSDESKPAGWPKIIGKGRQRGYIYKWAGSVAHLDDLKMVRDLPLDAKS
jgi:hypothetical protein